MITSRLPKTAATIIDIINDALNTVYEISNQSGSLTSPGKTVLDIAVAAASAETAAAEAKSNVVVVVVVSIAWCGCCRCDRYLSIRDESEKENWKIGKKKQ